MQPPAATAFSDPSNGYYLMDKPIPVDDAMAQALLDPRQDVEAPVVKYILTHLACCAGSLPGGKRCGVVDPTFTHWIFLDLKKSEFVAEPRTTPRSCQTADDIPTDIRVLSGYRQDLDCLLIPFHAHDHWTLFVYDFTSSRLLFYNSLQPDEDRLMPRAQFILTAEHIVAELRLHGVEIREYTIRSAPYGEYDRQTDNHSCAIHVCLIAEHFLNDLKNMKLGNVSISSERSRFRELLENIRDGRIPPARRQHMAVEQAANDDGHWNMQPVPEVIDLSDDEALPDLEEPAVTSNKLPIRRWYNEVGTFSIGPNRETEDVKDEKKEPPTKSGVSASGGNYVSKYRSPLGSAVPTKNDSLITDDAIHPRCQGYPGATNVSHPTAAAETAGRGFIKISTRNPAHCPACNKKFESHDAVKPHMLWHLYEKTEAGYVCKCPTGVERQCGKRFPTLQDVYDHLHDVHRKRKTSMCCFRVGKDVICGKEFKRWFELSHHARESRHSTTRRRTHKRQWTSVRRVDGRQAKDEEAADVRTDEIGQNARERSIWDVSGSEASDFEPEEHRRNLATSKKVQKRFYDCPEEGCDKRYTTESSLRKHQHAVHGNIRPHICEVCAKAFAEKTDLTKHLKSHSHDRPFHCDLCGHASKTKNALLAHLKSHSDERPHVCGTCDRGFKTSSALAGHIRTVHEDHRPYQCEICHTRFAIRTHLDDHLNVHTNERPYECDVCCKGFKSSSNLNNHKQFHDGTNYQCSVCGKKYSRRQDWRQCEKDCKNGPYTCSDCGEVCKTKHSLRKHMDLHKPLADRMQFFCDACGQPFMRQHDLNLHKCPLRRLEQEDTDELLDEEDE